MTPAITARQIIEANRLLHAREGELYFIRHPEQINFYQARMVRRAVDVLSRHLAPRSHILDLGCGAGYLLPRLLQQGFRMTGVDVSETQIQALRRTLPETHSARLVVSDAASFADEDDGLYDAVVISALLHHLHDYESLLARYCGKLRRGGFLLLFFEPLRQASRPFFPGLLHTALAKVDEFFYKRIMRARGIPLLDADFPLADYQRAFGGICPVKVRHVLERKGLTVLNEERYCARRYGISAWTANRLLRTQNSFNLLARLA